MKDVVKRDYPDFVIQYELIDNNPLHHFPASLLNFAYVKDAELKDLHFDIFPEFKIKNRTNEVLEKNAQIPRKGFADMWIVSEKYKELHHAALYEDRPCYLFKGDKIVGKAKIVVVYREYKMAQ